MASCLSYRRTSSLLSLPAFFLTQGSRCRTTDAIASLRTSPDRHCDNILSNLGGTDGSCRNRNVCTTIIVKMQTRNRNRIRMRSSCTSYIRILPVIKHHRSSRENASMILVNSTPNTEKNNGTTSSTTTTYCNRIHSYYLSNVFFPHDVNDRPLVLAVW